MNRLKGRFHFHLDQIRIIAIVFAAIIIVGAALLMLPFSVRSGNRISFLTALFSATSAVCVTGLSTVDVWSTYTAFGQAVILCMIQVGGLGFMTLITMFWYLVGHQTDAPSMSLLAESLGTERASEIRRINRHLIVISLLTEALGAAILSIRFIPAFGPLKGIWFGIFHSISAFCNAGFDLMGALQPGSSLTLFNSDPLVCYTLTALIIFGGIGFFVWDDLITKRSFRKLTVYSRVVLISTLVLLAGGTILFFFFESDNAATLGSMSLPDRIMNAIFQAVTPRTAGFAAVDQGSLTESSQVLTMLLMMIGGSAGSTAGGIKTVTIVILIRVLIANCRGQKQVLLCHRALSDEQIMHAVTLLLSALTLGLFGSFVLKAQCEISFMQAAFESFSGLSTAGLSLGITSQLSVFSKLLIILYMYLGRVGILTITMGIFRKGDSLNIRYPSVRLLNG